MSGGCHPSPSVGRVGRKSTHPPVKIRHPTPIRVWVSSRVDNPEAEIDRPWSVRRFNIKQLCRLHQHLCHNSETLIPPFECSFTWCCLVNPTDCRCRCASSCQTPWPNNEGSLPPIAPTYCSLSLQLRCRVDDSTKYDIINRGLPS